ncbi:4322_t:CDS:2 [Gigaspora margarita]|uniref:4322_t:CDS:1 n=1 Tax=Gigaspora margarita TaxID=4874 RepID=A0ABN7V6J9_GIGMA|nr:4322_t:CDS:2 [Gigaspora margarita]
MIDAVSHFMSNYYGFLNQAKEEPPKGFTYQPVDIIKVLEYNKATKLKSGDKSTESTSSNRFKASASGNKNNIKSNIENATLVTDGFYMLDGENVGVAVLTDDQTIFHLTYRLEQLNYLGAEKFILDMSNNIGGDNFTIPIIGKNFNTHAYGFDFHNPYSYLSFPSGDPFKNATSSLHLENLIPSDEKFTSQWTSEDVIIITNGFCAVTCALNPYFFLNFIKLKQLPLMAFLTLRCHFPLFRVAAGDKILNIPGKNELNLTIREAYDFNNDNIATGVLEYLFKYADYRLYYNESNARDPSFLWVDAANILNTNP